MREWWYPTAFSRWGDEEHAAIDRVLMSKRWTMGEEVEALEREFADFHSMRHGIAVNSGSSANLVAVAALFNLKNNPLKRGDKAIVPALAWSTTYAPLVQHGLDLVLADCDETWNVATFGAGRQYPRLVIGCSILGNPQGGIACRFAESIGAYCIEDNCESLGASIEGRRCGTFALMNTFSFFWSHQLSAIEGGMILTDDDECARLCRLLRNHGNDGWGSADFDRSYDFVLHGYNVRPLEINAAIAREQLKKLDGFCAARRKNAELFAEMAEGLPIILPEINRTPSPFGLHFTVGPDLGEWPNDPRERTRLVTALRAQGIDCRLPTGGSFRLHPYGRPWQDQPTPEADRIHRTGMFLGNAPWDISDKIASAVAVMREVLT